MANAETQVVPYQPGTTTRQDYLRTVRERLGAIIEAQRNPGEIVDDLRQFAAENLAHMVGQAESADTTAELASQNLATANATARRRAWYILPAAGIALVVGALGGAYINDSGLRPHFDSAVQAREAYKRQLSANQATYNRALSERDTAIGQVKGLEKAVTEKGEEVTTVGDMNDKLVEAFEKLTGKKFP